MNELVFFTSNRTKLAHLKYLGGLLDINISGFREKYFYASYHEPQIDNRETLLKQSYISALAQWKKIFPLDDYGFFFFEDTSVRIEALSHDHEFPGVHVKYWMKEMNFEILDNLIRESGGDRSVTVRSDLVLHIPDKIRKTLGLGDNLIWFFGESHGSIVEQEVSFKPNLLYPWLDNKTFNRWFVPDGFTTPISNLSITEADKVDFRLRALKKLVNFLTETGITSPPPPPPKKQLPLPTVTQVAPILLICGYSCAGKTTLSQWLRDNYFYNHLEASDFMYQEFWRRHGVNSNIKIGDFAESVLSQDPSIVPKAIYNEIQKNNLQSVVVSGFRSPREVTIFRNLCSPEIEVKVIFITSDQSTRFIRAIARGREHLTLEKFKSRDELEFRMGLDFIRTDLTSLQLSNDNSLDLIFYKFYLALENLISKVDNQLLYSNDSDLEDIILQSLKSSDNNSGHTTNEISKLAEKFFGSTKSKNNISRYFNQDYHPYYEVRFENNKFKYSLSNTGVSRAIHLMRVYKYKPIRRNPVRPSFKTLDLFRE